MRLFLTLIFLTFCPGVFAVAADAPAPRPMTLVDLVSLPNLGSPQISPDGTRLVFTKAEADWDKDRMISHIWMVGLRGGAPVQMTNGADGETSPRWAPDGSHLAFLAKRDGDEKRQIYVIATAGGEARRVSAHPTNVSSPAWAKDGQGFYFLAEDEPAEAVSERKEQFGDMIRFEEAPNRHLWYQPLSGGPAERLTEGSFYVRSFSQSRDGMLILHDRFEGPLLDELPTGELWLIKPDGSGARQITKDNQVLEGSARLSPDNRTVLYIANADEAGDFYYNDNLFTVEVDGGEPVLHMPTAPFELQAARWSADGKAILFKANVGVRDRLFAYDPAAKSHRALIDVSASVEAWDYHPPSGTHVFALTDAENAGDFHTLQAGAPPKPVTHVYDHLAQTYRLPRQEVIRWTGEDGTVVEGLLTYPLDYKDGQRVPLIVNTHGGPASTDQVDGFSVWEYLPVAAAHGYAVLRPNYRGSTGYGDAFLRDMVGSYFNQAHKDVMAGVDYLIDRGLADPERLVKMGWSAGGHMTNKIITFTDRFAAASSGAGAVNWISMYGQSDIRIYRTPWFDGTPWDEDAPIDTYWEQSPLKDIHKVTTPTLVLVGEKDVRVPPPQSMELYRALTHLGVPTAFYMAPGEPHGWRTLKHRLFKGNVELDWFAKHALGEDYVWEMPPSPAPEDPADADAQAAAGDQR